MGFWKKALKLLLFMRLQLLFILVSIAALYGGMYYHELAHQQIFNTYGVDSTMHIGLFEGSVTATNATQLAEYCDAGCHMSQDMVEAIGYQQYFTWIIIFAGFLLIISILESYTNRQLNLMEVQNEQAKTREDRQEQEG